MQTTIHAIIIRIKLFISELIFTSLYLAITLKVPEVFHLGEALRRNDDLGDFFFFFRAIARFALRRANFIQRILVLERVKHVVNVVVTEALAPIFALPFRALLRVAPFAEHADVVLLRFVGFPILEVLLREVLAHLATVVARMVDEDEPLVMAPRAIHCTGIVASLCGDT